MTKFIRHGGQCRYILVHLLYMVVIAACAHRQPTIDRVPPSAMKEALSYKAPFGEAHTAQPEIVAEGKILYEGKGHCFVCHGMSGKGDGSVARMFAPPPRDFTDCAFQKEREDGELFWIIKYGSPGTGMKQLIPGLLSEEEGWKIVAYVRTFCTSSL
jgi:mono/diheme cytochrome c family protein